MAESTTYLQIYFSGSMGFVMYNVFVGILQAIGDSRHPLYYLIISSVMNLLLDILFIGGGGPYRRRRRGPGYGNLTGIQCSPVLHPADKNERQLPAPDQKNQI